MDRRLFMLSAFGAGLANLLETDQSRSKQNGNQVIGSGTIYLSSGPNPHLRSIVYLKGTGSPNEVILSPVKRNRSTVSNHPIAVTYRDGLVADDIKHNVPITC